ncbi:hypothetical protein HY734_03660 [Candidatus Uhrbacteria bacterium]|nr:hypothetical protein [Candidatus Uhrbacteria bacterium]
MHQATCSECGNSCEVPFKPAPGRPVFCPNCFRKDEEGGGGSGGFRDSRPEKFSFDDKRMYNVTCAKCGTQCEVPFKPTGEKPVYCRQCFGASGGPTQNRGGVDSRVDSQVAEQLKALNAKFDALLKALAPAGSTAAPYKKEEKAPVKEEKPIVKELKKEEKKPVAPEEKALKAKTAAPKKEVKKKAAGKKK